MATLRQWQQNYIKILKKELKNKFFVSTGIGSDKLLPH